VIKWFKTLAMIIGITVIPGWVLAQATAVTMVSIRPAIICPGNPVTVTFEAQYFNTNPNGGTQTLALLGAFSSLNDGQFDSDDLPIMSSGSPNGIPLADPPQDIGEGFGAAWPGFSTVYSNFVTYTVVTSAPVSYVTSGGSNPVYAQVTQGQVLYLKVGSEANGGNGTGIPSGFEEIPVTVNCNESDGINTATGNFVSGGVTYSGATNPVTVLINNSCASPTFTNTPTKTDTSTFTSTPTNTFTPTISNTFTPTATNTFTKTYTVTFTNTFTPTITNTFTDTFTKTYTTTFTNTTTATFTNTFTLTFTNTPTATPTNTFMNSPTFTDTFTHTPTLTFTNTLVNTATNTNTFTNTPTLTYTNTFMNSPTFTNTFTNTPTFTYTNTLVNTATNTNTYTYTVTNTPTSTDTHTPTMTFTNTLVNTATFTNTFTSTNTSTPTYTFTVTPTFTSFVGIGKTVSETRANAGDVLTYNIAVTVTGNGITNAVITDVLPANMTFQAFGAFPSGSVTQYNAAANQLQWTLPSPLLANVYNLTYQLKVNTFAPANVPLTNNAQLTYAGLANPMKASVPVTVIGQFSVSVNIYNSAGEVVKTIPIQQFSTAINNITLSTTNTITTLTGPGSSIEILFNGYVIGVWNGTNNAGQPVSNGAYQVQIDNVSSGGVVTSVSQTAIVSRNLSNVEVDIYNEAGEVVRKLFNVIANPTTSNMTNVTLSSTVMQPNVNNLQNAPTTSLLQILVQDTNAPVTLTWDGTANSGTYVTPGIYEIEVHWTNGNGTTTDITRTILVLPNAGVSGIAVAKPNILNAANGMTTTFDAMGVANASSLKVKIYTIAGELVQSFASGTLTAPWNASGMASGIYIACVEVDNANGGVVNQQRLKILVIH
jgi:fimbrial isopeptide formation D2 family protein